MDDEARVAVMLRAVAEHGTVMAPVQELVRRARRRRRALQSLTVGGAAMVVAAAVLVPAALRGTPVRITAPAGPVSATSLTGYRWSEIPPAPIVVRQQSAVAWDGRQVLIWGGSSDQRALKDGAAYDPVTRIWAMLPASPLSARFGMAFAWTGRYLFVWGGTNVHGLALADGALYDPVARTWRMLPPAPLSAGVAQAAWTGSKIVLVEGVSSAVYDPASNTWRKLPALVNEPGLRAFGGQVVTAGSAAYLLALAEHRGNLSGIEVYRMTSGDWQLVRTAGDGPHVMIFSALSAGPDVIVPVSSTCATIKDCVGSLTSPSGYRLNLAAGVWRPVPGGPAGQEGVDYVWTGAALLGVNSGSSSGAAAAWDPGSGKWTRLASSPYVSHAGLVTAVVWAGDRLIEWGLVGTRATGLQFAPR